jgi:hypothetical protein
VLSLSRLGNGVAVKAASWLVYVLIPNLNAVDIKPTVVGEASASWASIAAWGGYLAAYVIAVLLAASWVFRRKEF